MRNTVISFGKLSAGCRFWAREQVWIKASETQFSSGGKFNAYDYAAFIKAEDQEQIPCDFFPDEMIVRYNPDEELTQWEQ